MSARSLTFSLWRKGEELAVLIDESDLPTWNSRHWFIVKTDDGKIYVRAQKTVEGKRSTFSLHREILSAPKGLVVDHINGNPLDNRRSNLRVCTAQQNIQNSLPRKSGGGLIGVSWSKQHGKWRADIKHSYRSFYLGLFDTPEEAARARDKRAIELRGAYARLNFTTAGGVR